MSEDPGREHPRAPTADGRFKMDSTAGLYFSAALEFGIAIIVFTLLGHWLDRRLGTQWLTILGLFLGAGGGFYVLYRNVTAAQRREDAARARERSGTTGSGPGEGTGS
jgi:F0F1-type ATP synthase assembly protein I